MKIIINIPDEKDLEVAEALGYERFIGGVENADTPQRFIKRKMIDYLVQITRQSLVSKAQENIRKQIEQSILTDIN